MNKTVTMGRREVVITERAGKFKLDFYLLFSDDPKHKENVGGGLSTSLAAAERRAHAWASGGET